MNTTTSIMMAAKGFSEVKDDPRYAEPERKLYSFPFDKGIFSAVSRLEDANIKRPSQEAESFGITYENESGAPTQDKESPRYIRCAGGMTHVLTRGTFSIYKSADLNDVKRWGLDTLFTEVRKDRRTSLVGRDATDGSIEVLLKDKRSVKELFLSIFLGDSEKENVEPGYLLHSSSGKVEDFRLVPPEKLRGLQPSGPLLRDSESVWVSCGSALINYTTGQKIPGSDIEDDHIVSVAKMGSLLCYTSCKEEAYSLIDIPSTEPDRMPQDIDQIINGEPGSIHTLPSLGTSVAMLQYKGDDYALMGMADGVLGIYHIEDSNGMPSLNLVKLVQFLSLDACIEKNQSNYIRHIAFPVDGYVSFSLRNLYLRMPLETLFEKELSQFERAKEKRLWVGKELNQKYIEYLKNLKEHFNLTQICAIPHRISSLDHNIEV